MSGMSQPGIRQPSLTLQPHGPLLELGSGATTMYAIHRAEDDMKRTQLYLDEDMARTLAALSRQKGATISQLVRESVLEKYMSRKEIDKVSLARQLGGIWAGRKDLQDIDRALRKLRRGKRLKRFGLG